MAVLRSLFSRPTSLASVRSFATTTSAAACSHGISSLGIVGGGQMGMGIAYVAAKVAKVNVLITDRDERQIERGFALVDKLLRKEIDKAKMTASDAQDTRSRLQFVKGIEEFRDVDMAIEAVSESLELKQRIFASLATHLSPSAILASNTSSISLSKIAASAIPDSSPSPSASPASASRVVGFHFFNPVPVMKLVELIPALQTSPEVVERARAFAEAMGKVVTVSLDTPGFVSNRLLMPFLNEAILALEQGVATRDDIDTTLALGMAHPMGPLKLADFIGLDTCLAIQETLMRETGDTKYRPSVLLGRMVSAGWMGKKSGKGFYEY